MSIQVHIDNYQVAGFAIITIAWIFSSTSMGLVEWRMWHMDDPSLSSSIVCVGMWRVCIYKHDSNFSKAKRCHQYAYHDIFLPLDIRTAQHLLLAASALGLLGKTCAIMALRNTQRRTQAKERAHRLFITAGVFAITACCCVSVAVFWNFHSVMNEERVYFPLSFHLPFQPGNQEIGSAMLVAGIGAFLLLLSGLFFLSYTYPLDIPVNPEN
ncbi:claudin-34 [Cavia porcellus]|uniref:claudin-34 n=1 Tax=Cavia porcellus TaxID=10141 RepID=UPI000184FFCA|nr:claudin-34 [Cavia porcellus]